MTSKKKTQKELLKEVREITKLALWDPNICPAEGTILPNGNFLGTITIPKSNKKAAKRKKK